MMRRAVLAACLSVGVAAPALAQELPALELLGAFVLPGVTSLDGVPVGGLSGLDYDPESGAWFVITDDPVFHGPGRFYRIELDYDLDGFHDVQVADQVTLLDPDGAPFAPLTVDPEAIRLLPGGIVWSSEGAVQTGMPPFLAESGRDGALRRQFALPPRYLPDPPSSGPRYNANVEGLALSPDGATLHAALEAPLIEDGPPAGLTTVAAVRILSIDLASGEVVREVGYVTDAIALAPEPLGGWADHGVSDILTLDADTLLVLERGYSEGRGNTIRIYAADLTRATDVSGLDSLAAGGWAPAEKRLVADFRAMGVPLANYEGMGWGPELPDGRRSLVLVSDDNFGPPAQTTTFLAFAVAMPGSG